MCCLLLCASLLILVFASPGDVQPITEYLSAEGLDYFLSTPPSRRTKVGMLQTFIHPKGTSNFIIRVSWTPEECTMNSCININRLADPDLEVQERAATNDEKHCVLIPMSGNVLAKQLERLCDTIAEHLHLASQQQYKVSSMVINFKIDNEDRVWLLWCEQLEVQDEVHTVCRMHNHTLPGRLFCQKLIDAHFLDGKQASARCPRPRGG